MNLPGSETLSIPGWPAMANWNKNNEKRCDDFKSIGGNNCGNHLFFFSRDIYTRMIEICYFTITCSHVCQLIIAGWNILKIYCDFDFFSPLCLLPLVFELPMLDTLLITWNLKHPSINGCCSWMTPNNYCTMVQIYVKALVRPFPTEKCCDSASPLLLVY